jgi:toluene monooxygenase system protein E
MADNLRKMKTWSGLAHQKRRPSEYEIVTTNLHTRNRHADAAYELSPAPDFEYNQFYKTNVFESPLACDDWEGFRDPDGLIYRVYTRMQDSQEDYIDGLVDEHNEVAHDLDMVSEWVDVLEKIYTPSRFVQGALQMNAAYIVQVAPSSTLTACAGFQSGDEFRWLSRVAYRTKELQNAYPQRGFGKNERKNWENLPALQGIRELLERTLATYDWGENFFVGNLVAKPVVDETMRQLAVVARQYNDNLTSLLIENQLRDSDRSRRWSKEVIDHSRSGSNDKVLKNWLNKWMPLASHAIENYCSVLPEPNKASEAALYGLENFHKTLWLD